MNYLSMGGFGIYVWPCFGFTFLVFIINIIAVIFEKKSIKKIIRQSIDRL